MEFIIVDDDPLNLFLTENVIAEVLGPQEVTSFTSGGAALKYLRHTLNHNKMEPVVVLLDLNMPVISGWDFLDEVVQFEDDLKNAIHIYVVSSSGDPKDKTKALFYPNVVAFINKPLTHNFIENQFKITS